MNQDSLQPTSKMNAVGIAGVLITSLISVLTVFGVVVPANVSGAALVLVSAIVTIVTFIAGYLKQERKV
jgi:hypothetical protein